MLRRIQVKNFMSLRQTSVDFGPLTILIGPNASGKSATFKALTTLSRLMNTVPVRGPEGEYSIEPATTLDQVVWQGNSGLPIEFRVWFDDEPDDEPSYTLEIIKETRGWSVKRERIRLVDEWFDTAADELEFQTERRGVVRLKAPTRGTLCHLVYPYRHDRAAQTVVAPFLDFQQRFGSNWRYRPSAYDIGNFWRPPQTDTDREREFFVGANGSYLSLVLQKLQGENRRVFEAIEEDLRTIFPHIRFINFQSDRLGVRLAYTTRRSEDLVPAPQESDGVLLTTFLLWRLHTAAAGLRICLEEPENGTHPYLLGRRLQLLADFANGKRGRPATQILVSTHSPDLLTVIEKKDDLVEMVRLVEFDEQDGTQIHKLDSVRDIERLLGVFNNNLGELWWSGAIGAVPSLSGRNG